MRADIPPDAERVFADPTALRQVIGNLVENAVRHTADGSVTRGAPDAQVVTLTLAVTTRVSALRRIICPGFSSDSIGWIRPARGSRVEPALAWPSCGTWWKPTAAT